MLGMIIHTSRFAAPAPRRQVGRCSLESVLLLGLVALGGCQGIEPVTRFESITDPGQLFMAITLDRHAINLSTVPPWDTIRVTTTPLDASGKPLDGLPAPTYRSSDTTAVAVSADGLLRARRGGRGILVVAEIAQEGNVRHADTAIVNVTTNANPPVLASLSIHPVQPDSAVWAIMPPTGYGGALILALVAGINVVPTLTPRALDVGGASISGLVIDYRSLDPAVVQFNKSAPVPLRPGQARIVASTTAYGMTAADTVAFTVTPPVVQGVVSAPDGGGAFTPSEVTLRPGGYVFWLNMTSAPVDVTFDDPSAVGEVAPLCDRLGVQFCGGGNIPAFWDGEHGTFGDGESVRARQFPLPGTYTYRNTLTGATGKIVVTDSLASATERQRTPLSPSIP